ncbi:DUF4294 domain-containing protein [Mucilaginibacter myungsuensis]|uniref:DUF4294 domain-containing protein n=1 Tax=Mucilaginibacter myungsuensis TaxID=649104 RepID=A0A929L382_9SPHI|nr:DUF4294 domain-containing protein [Mucilaginibacter myungsuensis]MBE9663240.1 DUF4294 domain-containing protein [Mucilaginibacter myungsuensis]MDN3598873.1 DUF4294 domain-containing protein [Mucilaginibacter myungsuensis]
MKFICFVLGFCCLAVLATAQSSLPRPKLGKNDTIQVYLSEYEGELIPWTVTREIRITDTRIFKSEKDRMDYNRLRYNVHKVLPYVRFASSRYQQLQRDLALTGEKKKQKELIKTCETQIKDLFNKEIKNLTITQGEILIKLVNRETGNTSFEMLKEMKGGLNAFMFQSVARIFGHNLKETYDPEQERDIESILQAAGYISYNN